MKKIKDSLSVVASVIKVVSKNLYWMMPACYIFAVASCVAIIVSMAGS